MNRQLIFRILTTVLGCFALIPSVSAHIDAQIGGKYQNITENNVRGDVNGDGSVSIGDVTSLIDYLLGSEDNITTSAADEHRRRDHAH